MTSTEDIETYWAFIGHVRPIQEPPVPRSNWETQPPPRPERLQSIGGGDGFKWEWFDLNIRWKVTF